MFLLNFSLLKKKKGRLIQSSYHKNFIEALLNNLYLAFETFLETTLLPNLTQKTFFKTIIQKKKVFSPLKRILTLYIQNSAFLKLSLQLKISLR